MPALFNSKIPIIAVGALTSNGALAPFTQYQENPSYPGSGVDIWAPGVDTTCAL